MGLTVGVLKELNPETRVSMTPETAKKWADLGWTILVEKGAGESAFHSDREYEQGAARCVHREEVLKVADLLCCIKGEGIPENLKEGMVLLGMFQPLNNAEKMEKWAARRWTVFSLDALPRTTRAQSMDVLSSQANIAGYKAVLMAAQAYCRYIPMFMTAAGSIPPARFLILGAGVAGLQAIATARRLGGVVEVFDTRPAVREEVLSLGGKFIEVEGSADAAHAGGYAIEQDEAYKHRQKQAIAEAVKKADIVITTAQIPGKSAPNLMTRSMIETMRNGSVIVDLAAATGGNTEATENGKTVSFEGVTIIGDSDIPARMPADASKLYSRNLSAFLQLLNSEQGKLIIPWDDELIQGACICHEGKILHPGLKQRSNLPSSS